MANNSRLWSDEYWLLLMQLYLKKPEGLKSIYSRPMVELGLELHIEPTFLYEQMFKLRQLETPRMEKLWERYGNNPNRLAKGVKKLRQMKGMGNADEFYDKGTGTTDACEGRKSGRDHGHLSGVRPLSESLRDSVESVAAGLSADVESFWQQQS